MKINWKVRLKNVTFWMTMVPATITFIYAVLAAFGITPGLSQSTAINTGVAIVTALAALGVLVDPTTKGVGDSERALCYECPADDHGEYPEAEG